MTINRIIEQIFNKRLVNIYDSYDEIKKKVRPCEYSALNTALKERIKTEKRIDAHHILLIAGIMKLTGSDDASILDFFLRFLQSQLSIEQYNFILCSVFHNRIPLSSDRVYDILNYPYLDERYVYKKASKLTEILKKRFNTAVALYLFLSSFRQDLSNENRALILLILNNLAPHIAAKSKPNRVLKKYEKYAFNEEASGKEPVEPRVKVSQRMSFSPFLDSQVSERKTALAEKSPATTHKPAFHAGKKSSPSDLHTGREEKRELQTDRRVSPLSFLKSVNKRYLYPALCVALVLFIILMVNRWGSQKDQSKGSVGKTEANIPPPSEQNSSLQKRGEDSSAGEEGRREEYMIERGDTLSSISKYYYNNPHKYTIIAEENNITNPHLIFSGRTLVIPELKDSSPPPQEEEQSR